MSSYSDIREQVKQGDLLIGADPATARRVFTNKATIEEITGEPVSIELNIEYFIITFLMLVELPSLLIGMIASIFAFKWYSLISIPLMAVSYIAFLGGFGLWFSGGGEKGRGGTFILLIVCLILAYIFKENTAVVVWFIFLSLPYVSARLKYKLAVLFLLRLAMQNEKAFNILNNKGIYLRDK